MKRFLLITGILAGLLTGARLATHVSAVHALSGSEFQAGRIIDDGVFFAPQDLSVAQIQQFLSAKVPTCDTNGTQIYSGSTTRATYGTSKGYPPPYTCLKDYRMDTPNRAYEAGLCDGYAGSNQSAAEIIAAVSKSCGINPKVLLVLLQKEQGLVTDDWPWSSQYQKATGYACPDTAPCDSQYYGFFNQLYSAARQYKYYAKNAGSFNYLAYRNNYIQYNPNANCGGSTVYIQNQATAGLYIYTPYQPNQYSLDGGSNSDYPYCGAFGNRNFWTYYNNWFGSTLALANANITLSQGLTTSSTNGNVRAGETITASYEVTNTADYSTLAGGLGICARLNGQNIDFGFADQTEIPAHGKVTVRYSRKLEGNGAVSLFICSYHASLGGWASSFYPYNTSSATVRTATLNLQPNPLLASSGISITPSNPIAGQSVTATFTLTNLAPVAVSPGLLVVAVRDPWGGNVDFPAVDNITIAANSTYTYSKSRVLPSPGQHSFFLANLKNGAWSTAYPVSESGSTVRSGTLTIKDNPLIISSVSFSPASPAAGQATTATFTIRNDADSDINVGGMVLAARDPVGNNVDFAFDPNITIAAHSTYTYSKSRSFSSPGTHAFFIANLRGNAWSTNYPLSSDGSIVRKGFFGVKDNPLIISSVSFSPASPAAGQATTATFTIRNDADSDINVGGMVLAARDPVGNNVDFAFDPNITIAAHSTYTYSKSRSFSSPGTHAFFIANLRGNAWSTNYPLSSDGSIVRKGFFGVKN